MSLYRLKKVDFEHEDERGKLTQLVHCGYEQVNVSYSKKGVTRGGHFHKESYEAFFVVDGSVEVTLYNNTEKEMVKFKKGDFFEIIPYTVHSMYFPEDCTLVALYDISVEKDNNTKDIFGEDKYEGNNNQ